MSQRAIIAAFRSAGVMARRLAPLGAGGKYLPGNPDLAVYHRARDWLLITGDQGLGRRRRQTPFPIVKTARAAFDAVGVRRPLQLRICS